MIERFFLLCCIVQGKSAAVQQQRLNDLLHHTKAYDAPLQTLAKLWLKDGRPLPTKGHEASRVSQNSKLGAALVKARVGQYTRLTWLLCRVLHDAQRDQDWSLRHVDRDSLVAYPGIGMKTASFFLLHSRRDMRIACLDVHVLRHMRESGLAPDAPSGTPADPEVYKKLEAIWLARCDALGVSPREHDFNIWKEGSGYR